MGGMSLLEGWFPWVLAVVGLLGGVYLLFRPERWWWRYMVPATVAVGAVSAWFAGHVGGEALFAQPLETSDIVWIGVAFGALALAVGSMFGTKWRRKLLAVAATVVVVMGAANQVNRSYAQFPALRDLFGVPTADQVSALPPLTPILPAPLGGSSTLMAAGPPTSMWTPTGPDIPADGRGKLSRINIANTRSGFVARPGWVYLPPAYFAENPRPLPVLVLMAGQPGSPDDWTLGDRIQGVMNDFAAAHRGISPVVVIPDSLGSVLANPLCADSTLGRADTYLSQDVPNAIRSQLRVDPDARHWAVAGFSYGGTCALQLATNHPDVYPHFIDIAGQPEPTLGSGDAGRQLTVSRAFGGDPSKFAAVNPADLLAVRRYPTSSGWFIWGESDPDTGSGLKRLEALAQASGMQVQEWTVPGTGHDWNTATAGVAHAMEWLATAMNLTT